LASEPHLRIYLAKSRFLSQVLNYQVACHGSLWRFWLRGTSADEHRKCDECLDGTFDLCHIFRREAPAPAMLHAFKLWVDPFTCFQLSSLSPFQLFPRRPVVSGPWSHLRFPNFSFSVWPSRL
jgi:hypothetical protein